jgi:hypothetical protein
MALGEIIYEHTGKMTGQRVLDVEGPKIETSFRATGKFKGTDIIETTTYWSVPRPGGALYGEAQGVVTTSDDSGEMATLTAQGIGRIIGPGGKVSFRGSTYFRTSSTGKLASLNNMVGVFEYEMDGSGNSRAKIWEWK